MNFAQCCLHLYLHQNPVRIKKNRVSTNFTTIATQILSSHRLHETQLVRLRASQNKDKITSIFNVHRVQCPCNCLRFNIEMNQQPLSFMCSNDLRHASFACTRRNLSLLHNMSPSVCRTYKSAKLSSADQQSYRKCLCKLACDSIPFKFNLSHTFYRKHNLS